MDHFEVIYAKKAREYHDMISPEDVDGNLDKAIRSLVSLENKTLIDLGTGTGRIPLLYHSTLQDCIALDLNYPMLAVQQQEKNKITGHWPLINADNRQLPFSSKSADVVTAGWAIGHLRGWYPDSWQFEISKILNEMERIAKAGATLLIMETLTTGGFKASPPTKELAEYYAWLESDWEYQRKTISTDFQYKNIEEAIEKTEFFFGSELTENIKKNNWDRIPEWTGVWHKKV